jgi:hypothetical protein
VVVNVRTGIEDDLNAPILRVKVRNEHFDNHRRIHFPNRRDDVGKMIGATVLKIVTGNCGDDNVF